MPATCAICLQPIVAGNDVRVFGTEVMHRACASSGRATVGTRLQQENAKLRSDLVEAQERARRLEGDWAIVRKNDSVRSAAALRVVEQHLFEALGDRDAARAAEATTGRLLTQALRERDEARAELARRTQAPDVSPPAEDERDATEIRFSLLDMD